VTAQIVSAGKEGDCHTYKYKYLDFSMKTGNFITVKTADIIDGEIYYVQKVEKKTDGLWVVSTIVEMKNFKTYNLAKVMQKTVSDFMA